MDYGGSGSQYYSKDDKTRGDGIWVMLSELRKFRESIYSTVIIQGF